MYVSTQCTSTQLICCVQLLHMIGTRTALREVGVASVHCYWAVGAIAATPSPMKSTTICSELHYGELRFENIGDNLSSD